MVLIDINRIKDLLEQAEFEETIVMNSCYNMPEDPLIIGIEDFVFFIKVAKQAHMLFDNLLSLHKECSDFKAGNFQPYIDEHKTAVEEDSLIYDPFTTLGYHFNSNWHTALPQDIGQYRELQTFTRKFAELRRRVDKGWDIIMGSESLDERQVAEREIKSINIEYCLDGCNEFYRQCKELIETHQKTRTIEVCSESMLTLYAPFPPL